MLQNQSKRLSVTLATVAVFALFGAPVASAQESAVYLDTIIKNPSPLLDQAPGREYKFLIDPAKTKSGIDEGFKDIWTQVQAAAKKQGFVVQEKEKNPLKVELGTKEYFDTKNDDLWKAGFLIRITDRFTKDGKPSGVARVTVKTANRDTKKVLSFPLDVVGVKNFKTDAEGGVGFGPGGKLREYFEKGANFQIPLAEIDTKTLGGFAKFVPDLLKSGLPANTPLVSKKAYSYRVKPGYVVLPGTEPCGVSMEAWTLSRDGAPILYDFSFGYGDIDFYNNHDLHAAGEAFMVKVVKKGLPQFYSTDLERWGGSKVRQLMNRPITGK